ncbi:hypothetical protein E1B28_013540 [Marasmius oreades]|uniref:Uncharacterized protein n=1 Tax=Marasmius oreades TaxID=181124 RepID=A0A9P7UP44_9AGAR|nr:uncharacterized protein E1B28_013540 [Marasmius oreades]KAG7087586.1 hypothetical protein E1B28_013540 [Marasmius oreades]
MNPSNRRIEHSLASRRARFHPYRRPVFPHQDQSMPYKPRIEDDTLIYLAFDVPNLSTQTPKDVPLEAEDRFNDRNEGGLGRWDLGLAVFILLVLRRLLMLVLLQPRRDDDGV